jgi:hypothetical protein
VPLIRLKISDNAELDEDEPAIFLCAEVHSEEVLGPEVLLNFTGDIIARYLQEDPITLKYMRLLEIFVVPFLNPEGRLVVEGGNLDWRKNKSDNDSDNVFDFHDGVDNNRNYDIGWSFDTTLGGMTPESLMYKGCAPFSESENRAMAAFAQKYKPVAALDYHSPTYGTGQIAYFPWNFQGGHGASPDYTMMNHICELFAGKLIKDDGTGPYSQATGYVDKGDIRSYLYGYFGTVVFTVEVCTTNIPSPILVDGIVARQLPGIYYFLNRALGPAITGVIRDSITLEPLEAEVRVQQRINADIKPRKSRADTGRYHRLLDEGDYTLRFLNTDYREKYVYNVHVGEIEPTTVNVLLAPLRPRPAAPGLLYPEPWDSLTTGIFTFDWSNPASFNRFRMDVSRDTGFDNLVIMDSIITISQYRPSVSLDLGRYYWRVKAHNTNGWGPYSPKQVFLVTAQNDIEIQATLPLEYCLYQNYPNPFNSTTTITFDLPQQTQVELNCYDITGALLTSLESKILAAGHHIYKWDGSDRYGRPVVSGIYFCRLKAGAFGAIQKMVLLK